MLGGQCFFAFHLSTQLTSDLEKLLVLVLKFADTSEDSESLADEPVRVRETLEGSFFNLTPS